MQKNKEKQGSSQQQNKFIGTPVQNFTITDKNGNKTFSRGLSFSKQENINAKTFKNQVLPSLQNARGIPLVQHGTNDQQRITLQKNTGAAIINSALDSNNIIRNQNLMNNQLQGKDFHGNNNSDFLAYGQQIINQQQLGMSANTLVNTANTLMSSQATKKLYNSPNVREDPRTIGSRGNKFRLIEKEWEDQLQNQPKSAFNNKQAKLNLIQDNIEIKEEPNNQYQIQQLSYQMQPPKVLGIKPTKDLNEQHIEKTLDQKYQEKGLFQSTSQQILSQMSQYNIPENIHQEEKKIENNIEQNRNLLSSQHKKARQLISANRKIQKNKPEGDEEIKQVKHFVHEGGHQAKPSGIRLVAEDKYLKLQAQFEEQTNQIKILEENQRKQQDRYKLEIERLKQTLVERDQIIEEQTEKIEILENEVDKKEQKICRLQMQLIMSQQENQQDNQQDEEHEEEQSELDEQEKMRIFEEYLNQARQQNDEELEEREEELQLEEQPSEDSQPDDHRRRQDRLMELVMGNMIAMRNEAIEREVQLREEAMLQAAIEESKRDSGVADVEQMTYEQLLDLEAENGGHVSRGLKPSMILKLPVQIWRKQEEKKCTVCLDCYKLGDRIKELPQCKHQYHSNCIDQWLKNEKRCPVCNTEVIIN